MQLTLFKSSQFLIFYNILQINFILFYQFKTFWNIFKEAEHLFVVSIAVQSIWDALRDLVPFVQFKKREKHPWRCVVFSKVAACNFTKSNTPPWVFSLFANCADGTKSRKASYIKFWHLICVWYLSGARTSKSDISNVQPQRQTRLSDYLYIKLDVHNMLLPMMIVTNCFWL